MVGIQKENDLPQTRRWVTIRRMVPIAQTISLTTCNLPGHTSLGKHFTTQGVVAKISHTGPYVTTSHPLTSLQDVITLHQTCGPLTLVVQGHISPGTYSVFGQTAGPEPKSWVALDVDNGEYPPEVTAMTPDTLLACAEHTRSLLPNPYCTYPTVAVATSSAGMKSGVYLRLWQLLPTPMDLSTHKRLLKDSIVDVKTLNPQQAIFVQPPTGVPTPFGDPQSRLVTLPPVSPIGALLATDSRIEEGSRDDELFRYVSDLIRGNPHMHKTPDTIAATAYEWAKMSMNPPLPNLRSLCEQKVRRALTNHHVTKILTIADTALVCGNEARIRKLQDKWAGHPPQKLYTLCRTQLRHKLNTYTEADVVQTCARIYPELTAEQHLYNLTHEVSYVPPNNTPTHTDGSVSLDTLPFRRSKDGKVFAGTDNLKVLLNSPLFAFEYNTRTHALSVTKAPFDLRDPYPCRFTNDWFAHLSAYVGQLGWSGLKGEQGTAIAYARDAAAQVVKSPVISRIEATEWDRVPRLDTFARDYLDAPSELAGVYFTTWALQCVARANAPGTEAPHVLILSGPTGAGKSRLLASLAFGDPAWHTTINLRTALDPKEYATRANTWIVELAEIDVSDVAHGKFKSFLSEKSVTYRPQYEKEAVVVQHQYCTAITTEHPDIFEDTSGGRRFFLVELGPQSKVTNGLQPDVVAQLWAEAWYRHSALNERPTYMNTEHRLWSEHELLVSHTDANSDLVSHIEDIVSKCKKTGHGVWCDNLGVRQFKLEWLMEQMSPTMIPRDGAKGLKPILRQMYIHRTAPPHGIVWRRKGWVWDPAVKDV